MGEHYKLLNQRFGHLNVIEKAPNDKSGSSQWKCKCDCGNVKIISGFNLVHGKIKTCGCRINDDIILFQKNNNVDKETYEKLKFEWFSMRKRCKKTYHNSHLYFERGIKVCDEWQDFSTFGVWAINNGYQNGLTLDRIDNNKGYSPDNCRWATWKEQQNNRRNNVLISYNGKIQTLKQWSEELGLNYGMIKARWQRGWKPPILFDENHKNQ